MRGSGDYDWKKIKIQSSVCWVRGSGDYDRKQKDTVICLAGCAVVFFFVVAGNFDYDQKKKIQSSVGGKLAVFLLWREIYITTGKKKINYDRKKKDTVVCLMGARFWRLRPKKKEIQSSVCWVSGSGDYNQKKKIQSSV